MKLAAVTSALDWSFRTTCSGDRFDMNVAKRYVESHVKMGVELLDRAGELGADVALAPEYFRGSELFISTPSNRDALIEDAPMAGAKFSPESTAGRLSAVAAKRRMYIAASYDARHGPHAAQTGVLFDRQGASLGIHVKHKSIVPGMGPPALPLWKLDVAPAGMLICADCEVPMNAVDLSRRGMKLMLLPGCGFMGKFYEQFVIVRALEHKCAVLYTDENRAMIVNANGEVLARTNQPDDVIVAELS